MKASDAVAEILVEQGVPAVFELIGGMITHLLDSVHRRGVTKIVSVHHEQAAAFAADAVGRLSGIPGVAMATSGPGATNLLTGIGSCYFDSSPAVFITGQVNRSELKGARPIRQLGFQETDIVSMAKPITKAAWAVDDPSEIPTILRNAFELAKSGRPGPVLVDLPMDVQRADIDLPPPAAYPKTSTLAEHDVWDQLNDALAKASRPLIIAGGGITASRTLAEFRKFAERLGIPVLNSLNAVDVLPMEHPLRVGMLGSYGNRWANLAIGEADVLIVLGSRLDIRQTGADVDAWRAGRTIFHVDVESGDVNSRVEGCIAAIGDLREFFSRAESRVCAVPSYRQWMHRIEQLRAEWPDTAEIIDVPGINPNEFIGRLSRAMSTAKTFVADVGQHQMWAAQSAALGPNQRFMTSGGMGSMGFALPAAVGAAAAGYGPVVLIAGDGGFQCNLQEMQTVVRNRLPIKMVILNNRCHGMVRQFQESYFDSRFQSTVWGYDAPDFARVAEAYGVPGKTISEPSEMDEALQWLRSPIEEPSLLQVMIDPGANAYPKIAFGRPMTSMEPHATPIDMEGT